MLVGYLATSNLRSVEKSTSHVDDEICVCGRLRAGVRLRVDVGYSNINTSTALP